MLKAKFSATQEHEHAVFKAIFKPHTVLDFMFIISIKRQFK